MSCILALSACSASSDLGDSTNGSWSSLAPITEELQETNDSTNNQDCSQSLAAFSAVSNMLMSGLSRPSMFDLEAYEAQLDVAVTAAIPSLQSDFEVFENGYRTAGEAVEQSRKLGGVGSESGAESMDEAAALLNDVEVTTAAENVATFLANGCSTS